METFALISLAMGGFFLLSMLRAIYRGMGIHDPRAGLVLAPLGGLLGGGALWFWLNWTSSAAAGGWMEREAPWPLSNLYLTALIVAGIAFLTALAGWQRVRQTSAGVSELAKELGGKYQAEVERDELGVEGLRLFDNWHLGRNRLQGEIHGLRFEMFDFTSKHVSRDSDHGSHTTYRTRTVVLVPTTGTEPWPVFTLSPRGWISDTFQFGAEAVLSLVPRDEVSLKTEEQQSLAAFEREYRLQAAPAAAGKLAQHLRLRALRQIAADPGWSIESCGSHLAFWRGKSVIAAHARDEHLEKVFQLQRALQPSPHEPDRLQLVPEPPAVRTQSGCGCLAGGLVGFFGAFVIMALLLFNLEFDQSRSLVFAWPFFGFACLFAGAFLGHRLSRRFARRAAAKPLRKTVAKRDDLGQLNRGSGTVNKDPFRRHKSDLEAFTPDAQAVQAGQRGHSWLKQYRIGCLAAPMAVGVLIIAAGFLIDASIESRVRDEYVETTCTVLDKRLFERDSPSPHTSGRGHHSSSTTYRPEFKIRYHVDGQAHEAWTYQRIKITTGDRQKHQEVLERFIVGKQYPCWYDPQDPGTAVLTCESSGIAWFFLVVGLVIGLVGTVVIGIIARVASLDSRK